MSLTECLEERRELLHCDDEWSSRNLIANQGYIYLCPLTCPPMRRGLCFGLLLSVVAGGVPKERGVAVVTQANQGEFAVAHTAYVMMVYAPWCGHSRDLLPKYEAAAKQLGGKVTFAKLDGTEGEVIATALDVKGYPTILFVRRGGQPVEYDGDRSLQSLVAWAKQKADPQLTVLETPSALDLFRRKHALTFVLFPGADTAVEEMMAGTAASTPLPCAISRIEPEEAGAAGVKAPALVAFKSEGPPETILSGAEGESLSLQRMEKFAAVESLPLVVTYSEKTEDTLFGSNVPPHVLLFHDQPSVDTTGMEAAARQLRGEAVFATVDISSNSDAAQYFDVDPTGSLSPPIVLGYSLANGTKFVSRDLEAGSLVAFVRSIQSGTQPVHLRSQPEPSAASPGTAVELVGSSFSRIVMDPDKDILVQFYNPTCGHCRKLAPVYASVAAHFVEDTDLVVAQIDGSANDIPGMVPEGFPTMIFFPKANKRGVEYDGSRDLHDIVQFIADVRLGREHIGGLPELQSDEAAEWGAKVEL